ncbi:hypothetical protein DGG96_18345 [Legionella qingyii]|uniref:Uncharacterized protein n=1 Tax=Legionella qingyii TaxID=2184757 RepID=A0A317TXL6_9GAMM|nr:hypothetical protein DGG96_18345 [Legionella qingyii]RUR23614.1 hypothetical protein ELY16_13095 [Legionella qingyii]RUR24169.1 hypothetical protein ELY20_05775 [Legionella qingyii]
MKFSTQLDKEFFSSPPDPANIFYAGKTAVNCEANSFSIKSLSTLKQLLAQEEETIFRFLVDMEGKLWFAFETRPHNIAPKHFQMTGEPLETACCLTAGNIKFTDKTGTVLKNISHRSGDFYPSFLSLRWVMAILILNEEFLPFKLPKIIVIKEIKNKKIYKHIWRLKRLKKWVDSFRHNETLINQLRQADLSSKTVHYEVTRHFVETKFNCMNTVTT